MKVDENSNIKMEGGVVDLLLALKHTLFQHGVKSTSQKILKKIYYRVIGVDFSMQKLDDLTITSDNKLAGTICGSSSDDVVQDVLRQLILFDKNIVNGTFLDYGSGKGRLVITARNFGFKQVIGIEFAKELVEIAQLNISKLNISNTEVIHMDATNYMPPKETRVIYFLNPFRAEVFHKVLPQIIKHKEHFENEVYIVYRAPIYKEVFNDYPEIKHIKHHIYKGSHTEFYQL